MSLTRVLVLSNRDPSPDAPQLGRLVTDRSLSPIDANSIALVACDIAQAISKLPGMRVSHRSVYTPNELISAIRIHKPHMVFNLCESLQGDSRLEVAAAWRMQQMGVSFTGSPHAALRGCLFKSEASHILERAGVPVPKTFRCTTVDPLPAIRLPAIVKPEHEDGSAGIVAKSVVHTEADLRAQIAFVLEEHRQPAVVQEYIDGREVAVSLLGWPVPRVLPLGEITFQDLPEGHPRILTYASKWSDDSLDYIGTPSVAAVLRPHQVRRVAAAGRRAFEVLGLRDYARVDMRLDREGNPYVIDVNPNCDLSHDGGFAKAAARAHISYQALIWEITLCALRRSAVPVEDISPRVFDFSPQRGVAYSIE